MMKKPELLAPAGGFEQLKYAIRFGADAVYVATDKFGLRQRAENFSLSQIPEVVSFAHSAGVKVFVTCNAYLHDRDTQELPQYLESLAASSVDAFIVSDLGVFRMAQRYAPNVALHVSTQASCSNTEAALQWYELGAKRIVCAREMNLQEIAALKQAVPSDLEIEVFVHGAMCMSISGRCLISDYLTGRPANQGHCAQPCRWSYRLEEETRPGRFYPVDEDERGTYLMSSDDLNMLTHLDELKAAGIDSLKIEGRNKKAFYVATTVNAYRQVLDGANPQEFAQELEVVSHRPYSTGFYFGPASQTVDHNDYQQSGDWIGEVLSCETLTQEEGYLVTFACRNRLYEGEMVEVLSPGTPVRSVLIYNLKHIFSDGTAEAVDCANVSMEAYSFVSNQVLAPFDIMRSVRKDPNHKN